MPTVPSSITGSSSPGASTTGSGCGKDKKHKMVVIEIGEALPDPPYAIRSYPLPENEADYCYYWTALHRVTVYKAVTKNPSTWTEPVNFKAIRFGYYWNDGTNRKYPTIGKHPCGLADEAWYRTHFIDYETQSVESRYKGAWHITGSFLIHDGPQDYDRYGWGTAGCVEIFGEHEFKRLCDTITQYACATDPFSAHKSTPLHIHVKKDVRKVGASVSQSELEALYPSALPSLTPLPILPTPGGGIFPPRTPGLGGFPILTPPTIP